MKFSVTDSFGVPQSPANWVTFTKLILNGKPHFLSIF